MISKVGLQRLVAIWAITIGARPLAAGTQEDSASFVRWVTAHAMPIQSVEPGSSISDLADLRPLKAVIGTARVVALGEPTHGAHEPLAFRNRLFRYLVEEMGFTAIALESGLPESRALFDFVAGGPGAAGQVARENLTMGFGDLQENTELVQWIREYNADARHPRKVRIYGIDLSLAGWMVPTPIALEKALTYLTRVDAVSGQRLRAVLQPYTERLSTEIPAFSLAERDALSAAIDDLIALLERERMAFIEASSKFDYEWACRNAIAARQADRAFRVLPPQPPGGGAPPSGWQWSDARDAAMADNVHWVLAQEGPTGRVLVFAHNGHVKSAPAEKRDFERTTNSMGQYLRSTLGDDLIVIGSSAARNGPGFRAFSLGADSVDAALVRTGLPKFLLDLRASRNDPDVAAWLAKRRVLAGYLLSPASAFDVLLFIDTVNP